MATLTSHSPSLSPKPSAYHSFASASVRRTRSPRPTSSSNSSPSLPKPQSATSAPSGLDTSSLKAQKNAAQSRINPPAASASEPLPSSPKMQSRSQPQAISSAQPETKVDVVAEIVGESQDSRTVDRGTQYTPPLYPPTYRYSQSRPAHPNFAPPHRPSRRERSNSRSSQGTDASARRGFARASLDDTNAPGQVSGLAVAMSDGSHDTPSGIATAPRPIVDGGQDESSGDSEETSSGPNSGSAASQASSDQAQPQRSTALTQQQRSPESHVGESASKRARSSAPSQKELPRNYWDCDVADLGILISDMLLDLVRINDKIPLKDGQLTRFHSRAPPAISVRDYLNRLIVHATLIPPILLAMVYYIDRLCALYPAFTISSLTVHRFLISAATVAAKGLSDSFWTNTTYARVGGVSVKELALLELEFLEKMEWRIVPPNEVLVDYYRSLVERNGEYGFGE